MLSPLKSLNAASERLSFHLISGSDADILFWSQVIIVRFSNPSQNPDQTHYPTLKKALQKILHIPNEGVDKIYIDFKNAIAKCLGEIIACGNTSYTSYMNLLITLQASTQRNEIQTIAKTKWPDIIHLETLSKCNAACTFCPYPGLPRNGQKMSNEAIQKIRDDLKIIPSHQNIIFQPFKVSEPFLENRLAKICSLFWTDHPSWTFQIITNGSVFNEKVLKELYELAKAGMILNIKFSLNEVHDASYKSLMNLEFDRTMSCIKKIIEMFNDLHSVSMAFTRVSTSAAGDRDYLNFCKIFAPRVSAGLLKKNDWLGTIENGEDPSSALKLLGCKRWTDLSITSSGEIALCCMDSTATLGLGNVLQENTFELFKRRAERFIPQSARRGDAPEPCRSCSYYQYTPSSLRPFSAEELNGIFK